MDEDDAGLFLLKCSRASDDDEIRDLNSAVDCVESAGAIMGIGNVRQYQGRYAEEISYYKRALKIFEKIFGADDINTANTINNLGNTYDSQGKTIMREQTNGIES